MDKNILHFRTYYNKLTSGIISRNIIFFGKHFLNTFLRKYDQYNLDQNTSYEKPACSESALVNLIGETHVTSDVMS